MLWKEPKALCKLSLSFTTGQPLASIITSSFAYLAFLLSLCCHLVVLLTLYVDFEDKQQKYISSDFGKLEVHDDYISKLLSMEAPVLNLEVAVFWRLHMVDLFYMLSGSKTLLPAGTRHLAEVVLPLKCPFTLTFLIQNHTSGLYEVLLKVLFLSLNHPAILSFLHLVTQLGAATRAALPMSNEIHRGACFRPFEKL